MALMGHEKISTTMGYYNSRELHQMGAFPQVAWLSGVRQWSHDIGSTRGLTCVACIARPLDA